jgi:hypothetical protein
VVEVEDIANVIGTLNRVDWRRELCVGRKVCGNGVRTGVGFARSEVLDKVWSQRLDDVMEDRRNSSQRCDGVKRDARLRGWEEEGAERRLQRYARHEVWEARGGAHH